MELTIFETSFLFGGNGGLLDKKKKANPTATIAATVAKTIATIAPADNPLEVSFL